MSYLKVEEFVAYSDIWGKVGPSIYRKTTASSNPKLYHGGGYMRPQEGIWYKVKYGNLEKATYINSTEKIYRIRIFLDQG